MPRPRRADRFCRTSTFLDGLEASPGRPPSVPVPKLDLSKSTVIAANCCRPNHNFPKPQIIINKSNHIHLCRSLLSPVGSCPGFGWPPASCRLSRPLRADCALVFKARNLESFLVVLRLRLSRLALLALALPGRLSRSPDSIQAAGGSLSERVATSHHAMAAAVGRKPST